MAIEGFLPRPSVGYEGSRVFSYLLVPGDVYKCFFYYDLFQFRASLLGDTHTKNTTCLGLQAQYKDITRENQLC